MLLEARGVCRGHFLTPKAFGTRGALSTADADACAVEKMVSSMLRDSPTPDAEEGSKKLPEETPIGRLVVPSSKFFVFAVLVFVTQEFFSRSSKSRGFCGEN